MDSQQTTDEVLFDLRQYAEGRKKDVERGAETPEVAALLLQKYGYGLAKAVSILLGPKEGGDVMALVDALVGEIDPEWQTHMRQRWEARPATLNK